MPTKDIIEFIFYIAPGFLALELYRSVYPARRTSEFARMAWSIIYGALIFATIKWVDQHHLNYALYSNSANFPELRFTMALLGTGIATGGVGILFNHLRFRISIKYPKLKRIAPDPQSIWAIVNSPSNKDWAIAFLSDGAIYSGWISRYAFNPNVDNQDFLLSDAKRVDEHLKEIYIVDGIGIYLNTKDVKRIEFVKGQQSTQLNAMDPNL